MRIEIDRAIKQLEYGVKELGFIEVVSILQPFIDRLVELTMNNKQEGKMLGWNIEAQREQIKKLSGDIDLLKEQNENLTKVIELRKKESDENIRQNDELSRMRLAEATKKLREVESLKEELEKKYFIKEAVGV